MQDGGENACEGSEGSSNSGDKSISFIGVLGELEHDHDGGHEEDSDNTGQLWNLDLGRLMPQPSCLITVHPCDRVRGAAPTPRASR